MTELVLDHQFNNPDILQAAITHPSAAESPHPDYDFERLEFLGDRVLAFVVAKSLIDKEPKINEGDMAHYMAYLVSTDRLSEIAEQINLASALTYASDRNDLSPSMLADATEALIAALYLDGGLAVAETFILKYWQDMINNPGELRDAKTLLQEWSQARQLGLPQYKLEQRSGPDHAPHFMVSVTVGDLASGHGEGKNIKTAEQDAAMKYLDYLKQAGDDA